MSEYGHAKHIFPQDVVPETNEEQSLGQLGRRWKNLFARTVTADSGNFINVTVSGAVVGPGTPGRVAAFITAAQLGDSHIVDSLATNGQLLIGGTPDGLFSAAGLTAGSGITITPGSHSITIAAINAGTVTGTGTIGRVPVWTTASALGDSHIVDSVATDGQLLIGATIGGLFTAATLTAGSGITITNAGHAITVATTTPVVTGSGTANEVAFWSGAQTLSSAAQLTFNGTGILTLGNDTAAAQMNMRGSVGGGASITLRDTNTVRAAFQWASPDTYIDYAGTLHHRDGSGAGTDRMQLIAGLLLGAPTGGDKGGGTINVATSYWLNGTRIDTPVYNAAGTIQSANHVVQDTVTLAAGTATVTLAGAAVFTNATSYTCVAEDDTAVAAVKVTQTSGSSITFTGTATDVIRYICVGN